MTKADSYRWRETYFVWFPSPRRPTLEQVCAAIRPLDARYQLTHPEADAQGHLESLTIVSPEDRAALEIDYAEGEDVLIEAASAAEQIRPDDGVDPALRAALPHCDARLEIMHFEQTRESDEDGDELDEEFDPSTLLRVLDVLARLTQGVSLESI